MITWIQKTFQQHFRLIFASLLAITIVSFIFTIGAPGIGRAGTQERPNRPFFGLNLNSADDVRQLKGDAQLSFFLQYSYSIPDEAELEQFAFIRQAALHLSDELGLPMPTAGEADAYLHTLGAFAGPDGGFDPKKYAEFRNGLRTDSQLREDDVARVLYDDARIQHVERLLAGPGYVLPGDVRQELALGESVWNLAAASVDYAGYNPTITADDATLNKYFDANAARYQIPAQVRVDYVDFPADAFAAQVTVTDAEVRRYFDQNKERFPKPAPDKAAPSAPALLQAPATPDADFAAVRTDVEKALRQERAERLAAKAAADFSVNLFEAKVTPATLGALLTANKLALKSAAPFTRTAAPAEFGGQPEAAAEAFKLGSIHAFSEAVSTGHGSAIMVWKESIAPRQPAFAEVRDKVTADYRRDQKDSLFSSLGRSVQSHLTASLKAGDTFEKAVADAAATAGTKIEIKPFPGFTLATRPRPEGLDDSVLAGLITLQKGQVAPMALVQGVGADGTRAIEKGLILYAVDKQVPDLTPANPKYSALLQKIAAQVSNSNGKGYLIELVQQELDRTKAAAVNAP